MRGGPGNICRIPDHYREAGSGEPAGGRGLSGEMYQSSGFIFSTPASPERPSFSLLDSTGRGLDNLFGLIERIVFRGRSRKFGKVACFRRNRSRVEAFTVGGVKSIECVSVVGFGLYVSQPF